LTPFVSQIHAPDALAGRVVLVTGGGTNLGKHAAIELVAAGADVVIAGRRDEVLEAAAEEIGERCSFVAGDIREPADATRIVETARHRYGRLVVLW
jgi:citronellol/citronellal dehydrogenase